MDGQSSLLLVGIIDLLFGVEMGSHVLFVGCGGPWGGDGGVFSSSQC